MTILVTGSTGTVGAQVVRRLAEQGASVRALARAPEKTRFPPGVEPVKGDLTDVDATRAALAGTDTLFLLNAVVPDEVTQALTALNLAREAGIERIVYFSVFNSDLFTDVPHFTGKHTVERMIEQHGLPATVLRPAYFIQNDAAHKEPLLGHGVYPMPVGEAGVAMVDARDIAEVAATCLLRRENAARPMARELIDVVGPDALTGSGLAAIWSEVLGKPIRYAGDDLEAFERQLKGSAPGWMAFDMRMMMSRLQQDGMVAKPGSVDKMAELLGRPPRTYRDFASETARAWGALGEGDRP